MKIMALVKYSGQQIASSWSSRNQQAPRHRVPKDVGSPTLDYDKLRALCSINGLKDRDNEVSSEEAHRQFMAQYHSAFVSPQKNVKPPHHGSDLAKRSTHQLSSGSLMSGLNDANSKSVVAGESSLAHTSTKAKQDTPDPSHDIRDHLPLLHKQRRNENPDAVKADRIKCLRRLLRKLPFERSAADNKRIYNAAKHFTTISGQVTPSVFRELCSVAQLDCWKDDDITVFGNTGLHLVLRGVVRPYNHQYMKHRGVQMTFDSPTPEPPMSVPKLGVGECFGTLEKVEGRDMNSRILTVSTVGENCELMKISTTDYQRVIEQIQSREQSEKVVLMQSCDTYRLWSKQPLMRVADLISWVSFPSNTVLVSEGYQSPFIAIIKTGECHVLRQVDVLHALPGGRKERRRKQVVMGKLGGGTSFGEVSVVAEEPMTCSIITASDVELACIEPAHLHSLDDVTRQLLLQSSQRTYADITKDDIQSEYITQEMKREWNEFKHDTVVDAINKKGIRPGYGKWSKDQK